LVVVDMCFINKAETVCTKAMVHKPVWKQRWFPAPENGLSNMGFELCTTQDWAKACPANRTQSKIDHLGLVL